MRMMIMQAREQKPAMRLDHLFAFACPQNADLRDPVIPNAEINNSAVQQLSAAYQQRVQLSARSRRTSRRSNLPISL